MMKINQLLNIEFPIVQGGMANIATGEFAAAVSNAGALGTIGAGGMDAETLREHIKTAKSLTDKPFCVNIMMMNPDVENIATVVADEHVAVVTTGAGNPGKYVPLWKDAGIKIFPVVSSVALAKRLASLGVDGLIAEGCEAGGHIGELTTMAILPQVCDAVDIPVIAAGGIAGGRQMKAAEILGASGVQIGTILLASDECPIHENYKEAIVKAKDNDTIVTGRIAGAPVRCLKNPMTREYVKQEKAGAEMMELEKFTLGSLRKAVVDGDVKNGSLMAGQVAGLVKEILPIRTILENMVSEYEHIK
ncbi:enoyl-[acyl-carrier protein] reductase II [Clostridiales Family XIII bacterium PM5-7]